MCGRQAKFICVSALCLSAALICAANSLGSEMVMRPTALNLLRALAIGRELKDVLLGTSLASELPHPASSSAMNCV